MYQWVGASGVLQKAFFDDSAITSSARTLKCKTPDAPQWLYWI
ncbi:MULTISPECIES: hypothetical protein [unclassified Microcoleus]